MAALALIAGYCNIVAENTPSAVDQPQGAFHLKGIIGIASRAWRLATLFLISMWLVATFSSAVTAAPILNIYFFWGDGCPHCLQAKPFLNSFVAKNPNALRLHSYEVWYDEENNKLMEEIAAAYDAELTGVPVIFIGDRYWIGFNEEIRQEVTATISSCLNKSCPNPWELGIKKTDQQDPVSTTLHLPFLPTIDVSTKPLLLATVLIAAVDGVNPCSLWVLSLLLGIVVNSGSRRKAAIVGITFLTITASAYGLFMVGLLNAFTYVGFTRWIQAIVAIFALVFGIVNIKDFFRFGQGPSLTISAKHKPGIYQNIRRIMQQQRLPATILATAGMALGITLVELPCTAGFPIIWSALVAKNSLDKFAYLSLLLVYLLIYLLDELVLFGVVLFSMQVGRLEEKHGRLLKLLGGTIMLALALTLLIWPAAMNSLSGSLIIFIIALVVALVIWYTQSVRNKQMENKV